LLGDDAGICGRNQSVTHWVPMLARVCQGVVGEQMAALIHYLGWVI